MSDTVRVNRIPTCDICKELPASFDGKTFHGPWAYMCPMCYDENGIGLGTGLGQRLTLS